jgi:hypothetical protein
MAAYLLDGETGPSGKVPGFDRSDPGRQDGGEEGRMIECDPICHKGGGDDGVGLWKSGDGVCRSGGVGWVARMGRDKAMSVANWDGSGSGGWCRYIHQPMTMRCAAVPNENGPCVVSDGHVSGGESSAAPMVTELADGEKATCVQVGK